VGTVDAGVGIVSWARAGAIIPQIAVTPYSGKRHLIAILRLVDLDRPQDIRQGFHQENHEGLLWQRSFPFDYIVTTKGYSEAAELRDKARMLSVQIGMAIAMWNGSLGKQEGETLKLWCQKILNSRSRGDREQRKKSLNRTLKDAYDCGKDNKLSLKELTQELSGMDDDASKPETIELCFDIRGSISADSSDKTRIINFIAQKLKLDAREIERIRDLKIVSFNTELSRQVRVEDLLGIDQQWNTEQIMRHLRSEFRKWNDRLTTLPEGEERNNAQRMLEAISEARRKYG
jgi:hypothetical protein